MDINPILDQIAEAVSEGGAHKHLEWLIGPRDQFDGHARLEAAADYIADTFRGFGLQLVEDRFRCEGR